MIARICGAGSPKNLTFVWLLGLCLGGGAGCPGPASRPVEPPPGGSAPPPPLVVMVVDDAALGPVIARQWRAHTEEVLDVRVVSQESILQASRLPADVIVFPAGLIGTLAQRELLQPLAPSVLEAPAFQYRDIFDAVRLAEMRWGQKTVAVPLGVPHLVLAYRADLLDTLGRKPPGDWAEYQQLLTQLADRAALGDLAPPADRPWRAALEPLAPGWAGQLLLARAASYALHRDQFSPLFRFDSMQPLIAQPPYVRALEELVASARAGDFRTSRPTPQEAMAALCRGECALAITWPFPQTPEPELPAGAQLDFALLPGSRQAYRFATQSWDPRQPEEPWQVPLLSIEGRLAAVCSSTRDRGRAQALVLWLGGPQGSVEIGPHSPLTTLFRASHGSQPTRWTGALPAPAARRYAQTLQQALELPRAMPGLTLPGRTRYLAALDEAVWSALEGQPARQALAQAAAQWEAITDELGRTAQQRAYAASLQQEAF